MASILFVDDEPKILNGIRRQLYASKLDWTFHYSNNASDAVKLLEEHDEISVVVTDIKMPDFDGCALISYLHSNFPKIRPIVLSGHCNETDQKRIEGMDIPFFNKPFPLDDLITTISLLLGVEKIKPTVH
ncbi:response regulator [Terasakiella sp. SH-1]|uniref:response regulator n=1 Tax=Terasakiella sp. SH-1 TaxID=2560057 RepID=UPI00107375E0|nr:response regulator [Terasakiella sp. SH-1]